MNWMLIAVLAVWVPPGIPPSARQTTSQAPVPATAPTETPSQFYLRYRSAVLKATDLNEVLAFWRTEMVNEFKQAPPDQRADLDGIKRIYGMLSDVNVVNEVVGPAGGATVTLEGTTPDQKKMTGTAYLVKENGAWKLFGPEAWR